MSAKRYSFYPRFEYQGQIDAIKCVLRFEEDENGLFVYHADYAALQAEVERLKSMLSMSQAIAEACGEPQGDGAITVKAATSTGKTVLTDIAAKEGGAK